MWDCLQNCSLCLDSTVSSTLALSSASYEWSVRRLPPPPPPPSLSFTPLSALCHSVQQEGWCSLSSQKATEKGGPRRRRRVVSQYIVGACTLYTYTIIHIMYACMYICIGMLWPNGLQIDYTVTAVHNSSAILHAQGVGHVESVAVNLWATLCTCRTHYQCFSFLAAFSFQQHLLTLVLSWGVKLSMLEEGKIGYAAI